MTSNAALGPTIIVAAASSVARAFFIAAAGYVSVRYRPKNGKGEPIIPPKFVGALARTNYLLLLCPLYYSAIGKAVTPSVLAGLWPVVVGFFAIILVGAAFSTALSFLPCFRFLRRKNRRVSFEGLRVVAALPNAVSLPLLVFPSLCEYDVVHEEFSDPESSSFEEMIRECTDNANVMIFLCQFAFCVYLFCMGQQALLRSSSPPVQNLQGSQEFSSKADRDVEKMENTAADDNDETKLLPNDSVEVVDKAELTGSSSHSSLVEKKEEAPFSPLAPSLGLRRKRYRALLQTVGAWLYNVFGNAGSIAMLLGLATGCIPWLPSALFVPGGSLRFLGGAVDALGQAATPVSLLVVGASLVDSEESGTKDEGIEEEDEEENDESNQEQEEIETVLAHVGRTNSSENGTNDFGESRPPLAKEEACTASSLSRWRRCCLSEEVLTHVWLVLSRLVVVPAVVCALLIGLDCGFPGTFGDTTIPHLYKLVMLVVSASPSAMTIIVILKAATGRSSSNEHSGHHASYMAQHIAKLYLPLYTLSTVTVAFWAMAGLWISLPDEDGRYFCEA